MKTLSASGAAARTSALTPDLKKRIDIIAEHVARNGADFEHTIRVKNESNPQFSFLFHGEGSEYYQQTLKTIRGRRSPGSAENGTNLVDLVERWREPSAPALPHDAEERLTEIVASLEQVASRDAIRAGRAWIEANTGLAQGIAGYLMKRIVYLPTCAHRLHVLFLLHDVLQTEATRQESGPIVSAFKAFLVWLLRPSYQLAQSTSPSGDDGLKILKLLQLWGERGLFSAQEAQEVKAIVVAKELPSVVVKAPVSSNTPQLTAVQHHPYEPQHGTQLGTQPGTLSGIGQPQGTTLALAGLHSSVPVHYQQFNLKTPMSMAQQPQIYRPPLPALPGPGALTPETVPVGVMSTMLKQVSRRGKDLHSAFVPYKPLDPLYTPQTLPVVSQTPRMAGLIQEFHEAVSDFMKDDETTEEAPVAGETNGVSEEDGKQSAGSARHNRSRSRSRSAIRHAVLALPDGPLTSTETPVSTLEAPPVSTV